MRFYVLWTKFMKHKNYYFTVVHLRDTTFPYFLLKNVTWVLYEPTKTDLQTFTVCSRKDILSQS